VHDQGKEEGNQLFLKRVIILDYVQGHRVIRRVQTSGKKWWRESVSPKKTDYKRKIKKCNTTSIESEMTVPQSKELGDI
jgi:hypothetical protein